MVKTGKSSNQKQARERLSFVFLPFSSYLEISIEITNNLEMVNKHSAFIYYYKDFFFENKSCKVTKVAFLYKCNMIYLY